MFEVFLLITISPNSVEGPQNQEDCTVLHMLLLSRANQCNAEPGKRGEAQPAQNIRQWIFHLSLGPEVFSELHFLLH